MNLKEALEILTYPPAHTFDQLQPNYSEAARLSIEALKAIKLDRKCNLHYAIGLLPGETEN